MKNNSANNKKPRSWLYIIISIVVLVGIGILVYAKRGEKVTYKEHQITKGDLYVTILSTGTIQPENRLEIKPPVAGRIEKVLIQEGEKVKKGQILAWMSSTERAALIDSARSQGAEELKRWEDLYKPTPIIAPIAGMIISKNVESGQTFTTSDAVLVMSNRLTIKAQVDETDLGQIKIGQLCEILLDSYPNEVIKAKVDRIAYEAKTVNNVTTYVIDVLPETTPEFMRSGMTANVTFNVDKKENILVLPTEFIRYETGKPTILLKNEKSEPEEKEIRLGSTDGKQSEILGGVELGETILFKINRGQKSKTSSPFSPFGGRPKGSGGSGR